MEPGGDRCVAMGLISGSQRAGRSRKGSPHRYSALRPESVERHSAPSTEAAQFNYWILAAAAFFMIHRVGEQSGHRPAYARAPTDPHGLPGNDNWPPA